MTAHHQHRETAASIVAAIAAGKATVADVARQRQERIAVLDPVLKAWVSVDPSLEERATAREEALRSGEPLGPLQGVPIGIKDIFDVSGLPTRAGSKLLADAAPAAADSTAVARLRAAGALVIGKTATTDFAAMDPAATVNPWNTAHTPGGSSSGSAAAVAAGMVPVALGTQTAGSVLRPASFCGVVGFKPSFGAIPRDGVVPFAWSLDTVGVFTTTVEDASLLYYVLTERQAQGRRMRGPPRLGYLPRLFRERLQPSMRDALSRSAAAFRAAGARMEEPVLPADFEIVLDVHQMIMLAEAATYHLRRFGDRLAEYGPKLRQMLEAGATIPATWYLDAQRVRSDMFERLRGLFDRVDALLLPAAPGPAPRGLESTGDPVFNVPASLFGLPAMTLCAGLDADGLPLGIQLVGGPGGDEALLGVAAWCEGVLGPAPVPVRVA